MNDPLTTSLLVNLAVQEFIKSGTGELAKRFTTEAISKIPILWEKIKTRLTGKSAKVDDALARVENGDSTVIETITKNLDVVLDEDRDFAEELRVLAQTIQAGKIQDNSSMVQNNSDNAKGWQTKVEGGTAYIGENHINQAQTPKN
ncbi:MULTISPECIES: hypothetical protein [unclassified Microcystis]|jgi:hypothetical protein|uniref:hypothetical protein n=1 Tax=unclassified Microcystis TaxID=2643300 RepID=UPI00258E7218|nr:MULTISPECIES: hypothetical protein [unclassified Microcystis]MCA2762367.1 hypothetical protein [Microcystis sp. M151S2]MCA2643908.1 hypothetical protein [Microcystis sp. M087S2]MCA2670113.1 hypothetical protein [Microcystis sp. M080S2]MCA2690545.1 hypothetical protein [Microcystis sp. M037S2]MCA2735489.1 hypothetical protein [Microcystis sp. M158S2]